MSLNESVMELTNCICMEVRLIYDASSNLSFHHVSNVSTMIVAMANTHSKLGETRILRFIQVLWSGDQMSNGVINRIQIIALVWML
jgi:hypothetical protein